MLQSAMNWSEHQSTLLKLRDAPSSLASEEVKASLTNLASDIRDLQLTIPQNGAELARIAALGELFKQHETMRQSERAHVLSLAQLVLINVLLPVLTGLLGYIFGTGAAGQPPNPQAPSRS